jgi:hypothetical protein
MIHCTSWQDQDLFIEEVFINARQEVYIVIKNLGHTPIHQKQIRLNITWNEEPSFSILLDTVDPHFRKSNDSSIIRLPVIPRPGGQSVAALIDVDNVVNESNENHNFYFKRLGIDSADPIFYYPKFQNVYNAGGYDSLMEKPPFANQVIWYEAGQPYTLSFWPNHWKSALHQKIKAAYDHIPIPITENLNTEFERDQAFDIYLSYIAHAMILEMEQLLPWTIQHQKWEDLGYLWNSQNYFDWDPIYNLYRLDYQAAGGISLWHPIVAFHFASQLYPTLSTIFQLEENILTWSRNYLHHDESNVLIQYQRPVDILYPAYGHYSKVYSCWATAGLLLEIGRAMNFPVKKFMLELHNGHHAGIQLMGHDLYLLHADDLYDPLFYAVTKPMPVQTCLWNTREYQQFLAKKQYCIKDSCHTPGTQHSFDRRQALLDRAIRSNSDHLAYLAASSTAQFKSVLRGDEFPSFLRPLTDPTTIDLLERKFAQLAENSNLDIKMKRFLASKKHTR